MRNLAGNSECGVGNGGESYSALPTPNSTLDSVALCGAEHFINRRHAAEDFQPGIFAKGSHSACSRRLADFPAAGSFVGQLANRLGRDAQLKNALPAFESKLAAGSAALWTKDRVATLYVFFPGEIFRHILAFWFECFFVFRT